MSRPDIMSAEHDIDRAGSVSTMTSSHDPLIRDERSSTEPFVVNEEGRHPGVLVGGGLLPPNNLISGAGESTVSWENARVLYNKCKPGDWEKMHSASNFNLCSGRAQKKKYVYIYFGIIPLFSKKIIGGQNPKMTSLFSIK